MTGDHFNAGDRVLTADMTTGTIVRINAHGWHDVILDTGQHRQYDASRLAGAADALRVWGIDVTA
ncbi:hypothetical protein [Mycobacterium sp.]|uniref:hypothetical protein n=1 Tax=Mycobacterium sp. TaxID=1785 RepID=UPI00263668DF|nr:hypothetical protein [Mycobacterium sp.]